MTSVMSKSLKLAGILSVVAVLVPVLATDALARGGGFGGGGFHGGGGGFGGGGFHGGGFGGGGFHAGGWHAGGVGGTWHADGYHAGGWDAAGFHGPTVVNHYYNHGCTSCRWGAVNHYVNNWDNDDDDDFDVGAWVSSLPADCSREANGEWQCGNVVYRSSYGNNGLQYEVVSN